MINEYIKALAEGVTNGYGYIEKLTDVQIDILCGIVNAISKIKYSVDKDGLRKFTKENSNKNNKIFEKYIENVILATNDLKKGV